MKHRQAFTIVEIAICLAIIGFALVAIIGILPLGMQVQRDNRSDTLINQDANYLMEAIRHGAEGLDDLTNFVDRIDVVYLGANPPAPKTFIYGNGFVNGREVIGLLSYPASTNNRLQVVARVRGISGSAAESSVATREIAFKYQLTVQNEPIYPNPELAAITNLQAQWQEHLRELRLEFRWPLLAGGKGVGNGHQVYRILVSGDLVNIPTNSDFYFFRP